MIAAVAAVEKAATAAAAAAGSGLETAIVTATGAETELYMGGSAAAPVAALSRSAGKDHRCHYCLGHVLEIEGCYLSFQRPRQYPDASTS